MEDYYLSRIEERIDKALENNMPEKSKLLFAGELQACYFSRIITAEKEEELLKKLGYAKADLFPFSDYVIFGEPQEGWD